MAASCRLRCCAVTAAAAEGDLRLPNPRLARSEQDRIKRRPIALPRGQGSGESAPWWRHTRVLARGHAAQGESRCVSQTGSYVTRVTGIARPVSDTVSGHHKSRYFPFRTGDPRGTKAATCFGSTRPSGTSSTICFASDNELSELCRCVRVLMLDACDRERCARGRHVGVGLRCAEPEL